MVLTAKEFNSVVALVEVEVEVAAALRAFENAGKDAGLLGDGGPPPAGPLFHALHLFPGGPVYNGLVDVEEDCPVLLRVLNPLFHLVGLGVGFPAFRFFQPYIPAKDHHLKMRYIEDTVPGDVRIWVSQYFSSRKR